MAGIVSAFLSQGCQEAPWSWVGSASGFYIAQQGYLLGTQKRWLENHSLVPGSGPSHRGLVAWIQAPWSSLVSLLIGRLPALASGHSRVFPPSELPPMVFLLPFSFLWGPHNLSFLPKSSSDLSHPFPCREPSLPAWTIMGAHALYLACSSSVASSLPADEIPSLPGSLDPPRLAQLGSPRVTAGRHPIKLGTMSSVCSVDLLKTLGLGGISRCVVLPFCTWQQ